MKRHEIGKEEYARRHGEEIAELLDKIQELFQGRDLGVTFNVLINLVKINADLILDTAAKEGPEEVRRLRDSLLKALFELEAVLINDDGAGQVQPSVRSH